MNKKITVISVVIVLVVLLLTVIPKDTRVNVYNRLIATPTGTATNTPTSTPLPTSTPTSTPIPTETNTPLPTSTATNTPLPTVTNTATPLPVKEIGVYKEVGRWGMKLYDVKRAKVVWFYGDGEYAQGVWFMPFIEFKNNGAGTRSPWEDLTFYFVDDAGRIYDGGYNDAWIETGWQYQTGDIMDDINPGSILGIVMPIDTPEYLGGIWLRVVQDKYFSIYLGTGLEVPIE